jgi:hypothetical protein
MSVRTLSSPGGHVARATNNIYLLGLLPTTGHQ